MQPNSPKEYQPLERLMKMMVEIRCHPNQTPEQLYQKLGVSKTQFYKDRKRLQKIGFQFRYRRSQKAFEITHDVHVPSVKLQVSELTALIMTVKHLESLSEDLITYKAISAINKLIAYQGEQEDVSSALQEWLRALRGEMIYNPTYGCRQEYFSILETAMREKRTVTIIYYSMHAGKTVHHTVDVYMLYFKRRALYMDAFCREEGKILVYRLNRLRDVQLLDPPHYFRVVDYDFVQLHRGSFSVFVGSTVVPVKIAVAKEIAQYIEEVLWHPSQRIEKQADGSLLLYMEVTQPREVVWEMCRWGSKVEWLEPRSMRKEILAEARQVVALYSRDEQEE